VGVGVRVRVRARPSTPRLTNQQLLARKRKCVC
jgi:hypothetical protein